MTPLSNRRRGNLAPQSPVNVQTGTTYTVAPTDHGRIVSLNNASAVTVTVPMGLPKDFSTCLLQLGLGRITVSAGTGVTLSVYGNNQSQGQYAPLSLNAYDVNTLVLSSTVIARQWQIAGGQFMNEGGS